MLLEEGVCYDQCLLLAKLAICLCPASFCIPRPNMPVTPDSVHRVAEGRTRLNDLIFTFHFDALEREMATHSSVLAWRIPGMGEPGGLPSMGSHRVGK